MHLSLTLSDTTKKPQKIIWSGLDGFTSSKQNPSLVARKSGFYKVTVTVSGAEISDSIWVEVSNPTPKIIAPKRFCQGDTIEILVDKEFPSYFWSTGDTTKKIKIHNPGTYFVTVIDSNNCIGRDTVFIESDFVTAKIFCAKTICKGKEIVLEAFPKGSHLDTFGRLAKQQIEFLFPVVGNIGSLLQMKMVVKELIPSKSKNCPIWNSRSMAILFFALEAPLNLLLHYMAVDIPIFGLLATPNIK